MKQNNLLQIIKICLEIDKKAARIYKNLSSYTSDAKLKIFWQEMSNEELCHCNFWKELISYTKKDIITDKKPQLMRRILREFTIGPDLNGYFIILGGLLNLLMPALVLCLLHNVFYLLLRLFTGFRRYLANASSL